MPVISNFRRTVYRTFFFETGLEYTHTFSADSPQPGYIKPSFGAGWKF
jgi:hypothetical protein